MRNGIYCRVSGEEQREKQTVETQRDWLRRYCDLHQIRDLEWYVDEGWSGTIPLGDRPDGARLLAAAARGELRTVYVYRIDRLARDPRLILDIIHALEKYGVEVRSATEAFDTASPAGKAMLGMLSVFAGFERDSIRERCVAGQLRAARNGTWMGGPPPFGYRAEGEDRTARLVPDDHPQDGCGISPADAVRLMFQRAATGASCWTIAQESNVLGVRPPLAGANRISHKSGRVFRGTWTRQMIGRILRNETYCGTRRYRSRGGEEITQEVPALVTREAWESAQATLRSNQMYPPESARRKYLLRGLISCGACGLGFYGNAGGHRHPASYRCASREGAGSYPYCGAPALPMLIEETVWADCLAFLTNHEATLAECAGRSDDPANDPRDLQRLRSALARKVAERNRLFQLYRRGMISDTDIDAQLAEVDREESGLKLELERVERAAEEARISREALRGAAMWLEAISGRLIGELAWEERKAIVDLLVSKIIVKGEVPPGKRRARPVVEIHYRFEGLTLARKRRL